MRKQSYGETDVLCIIYLVENEARRLCRESGSEEIVTTVNEHPRTGLGWSSSRAG